MIVFGIYCINLLRRKPENEQNARIKYHHRLRNIAIEVTNNWERAPWHLIGLCEAFYKRKKSFFHTRYVKKKMEICLATGKKDYAIECFDAHLRNGTPKDIILHRGEIGVIANIDLFEKIGNPKWELLGYATLWTVKRRVLGARFRIKDTSHIIPFYSTHISPFKDNLLTRDQRRVQVKELVERIKEWWIKDSDDWTPIIVGDFNTKDWNDTHWDIMEEHFVRLKDQKSSFNLYGNYMQIWFGKPTSFKGCRGTLLSYVKSANVEIQYDSLPNYTDHPAIYIKIELSPQWGEERKKFSTEELKYSLFSYLLKFPDFSLN